MTDTKIPTWFWVVAALAAIWNLIGVGAYLADVTMSEDAVAAMPDAQRALHEAMPSWVVGTYAIAVFSGLGAALALLLRRRIATALFALSFAAVVVQMGYIFVGMNAAATLGAGAAAMPITIILVGALLLWFSLAAGNRAWLR